MTGGTVIPFPSKSSPVSSPDFSARGILLVRTFGFVSGRIDSGKLNEQALRRMEELAQEMVAMAGPIY